MAIRVIAFDFGNVVGFFDYRPALQKLSAETGIAESLLRKGFLDAELEDQFESGQLTGSDFFARIRQTIGLHHADELLIPLFADIFQPNDDVCALIPLLKKRYRLLLGSNTNEIHSRHFRRQFADTLAHFDHLVLSHEVGQRKPKREFFEQCHARAGCPAEECVFIDDLPANIAGAQRCGWHGIVYTDFPDLMRRLDELGVATTGSTPSWE